MPHLPAYESPLRRRARVLRRLANASRRPGNYPTARVVRAFWWDGHPNFGDALTPWLLERYGMVPVLTTPDRAQVAGVGSIIEQLPLDYSGTIWGSGLLRGEPRELPDAHVVAVRGPLTRAGLGVTRDIALGDPGILVSKHLAKPPTRWALGIVPHGVHTGDRTIEDLARRYPDDVQVFDTAESPRVVLRGIARCAAVISTSLHGLITADSFGIPAAWAELDPPLWGTDFKFRDYEAVVTPGRSRRTTLAPGDTLADLVGRTRLADGDRVAASAAALETALRHVPGVADLPFLALRHR
jgi:hypothetical protein